MKTVKKFTTFEELKISEAKLSKSDNLLKKHSAFQNFLASLIPENIIKVKIDPSED